MNNQVVDVSKPRAMSDSELESAVERQLRGFANTLVRVEVEEGAFRNMDGEAVDVRIIPYDGLWIDVVYVPNADADCIKQEDISRVAQAAMDVEAEAYSLGSPIKRANSRIYSVRLYKV